MFWLDSVIASAISQIILAGNCIRFSFFSLKIATILLQKTKDLVICKFLERYLVSLLSDHIIKPFMIASSVVINLFCIIIK